MYLRALMAGLYEKVTDPDSGATFYFNKRTGESSWVKPVLLGSGDLDMTPRTRQRILFSKDPRVGTPGYQLL